MPDTGPLVTIMIPTYNQARLVGKAIESALAQTYQNLEVVVADDASTDGTGTVVEKYAADPRLRYCRNDVRKGRVGNYRHTLYEQARGLWVLNVDGDDYLTDNRFVEDAMRAVAGCDDIVMVCAGQRVLLNDGRSKVDVPTRQPVEVANGVDFFLRPFGVFATAHLSTLYRRDIATRIDFYRYDIPSADRESLWRLSLHGRVIFFGRAVGNWRIHGSNTVMTLTAEEVTKNMAAILEPYQYALAMGVDEPRLNAWRDKSLATYVASHAPLVAGAGLRDAVSVLRSIRPYRRAYVRAWCQIAFQPLTLAKWSLLAIGGNRAFVTARALWHRMTWVSGTGSQ